MCATHTNKVQNQQKFNTVAGTYKIWFYYNKIQTQIMVAQTNIRTMEDKFHDNVKK